MRVFISWSGHRSRAVAVALQTWLEQALQACEPWLSMDIDKGARWSTEIARQLEESSFGIICLTPENVQKPWILFEAGALSKAMKDNVCTFLLDLRPADIEQPLAQFNHTSFDSEDIRRLLVTLNKRLDEAGGRGLAQRALDRTFDTNWPALERDLHAAQALAAESPARERPQREILEEILELVRASSRPSNPYLQPFGVVGPSIGAEASAALIDRVRDLVSRDAAAREHIATVLALREQHGAKGPAQRSADATAESGLPYGLLNPPPQTGYSP